MGLMQKAGVLTADEAQDAQGAFKWRPANRDGLLKLECRNPAIRYLRTSLAKQTIQPRSSVGTMSFQSPLRPQHTADLGKRFRCLSITYIPPDDIQGILRGQGETGVTAGMGAPAAATVLPALSPLGRRQ